MIPHNGSMGSQEDTVNREPRATIATNAVNAIETNTSPQQPTLANGSLEAPDSGAAKGEIDAKRPISSDDRIAEVMALEVATPLVPSAETQKVNKTVVDTLVSEGAARASQSEPETVEDGTVQITASDDAPTPVPAVEAEKIGSNKTETQIPESASKSVQSAEVEESNDRNVNIPVTNQVLIPVQTAEAEKIEDGSAQAPTSYNEPKAVKSETAGDGAEGVEWEIDSSPIQSSSDASSDSSTSSDDSDESGDDDYTMLDPAEQTRMLMEGDGGSDDEGGKKGDKDAAGGQLRTKNEKSDEIVEKPDITVTPDMVVDELGFVENLVENLVLIKAKTSGEYRVLETGSVLCLEDRSVIGVVAETLGRVQQPFYSVRFTNAAGISEAGITKGTKMFYVEKHSTYVFTEPLKAIKGSDASNLHDEEVGEDEMEFSDDEAEAEHKRRVKQDRRARKGARFGTNGGSVPSDRNAGPRPTDFRPDAPMGYNDSTGINYDDNDGEELYTPLARPSNLHEMMGRGGSPVEGWAVQAGANRGWRGSRGGGDRNRGRGERGRGGRAGRGDRGRDLRPMRGNISQPQNGDRPPFTPNQQQQYGYGATTISSPALPSYSPQQSQFPPQASHFPPHLPFPPNHSQQAFSSAQHNPQAGFSMPPQNNYPHQQQYSPQNQYPQQQQQQQHQHQQYPHQQPFPQQHPVPTNPNSTLPPGAFLNPAFFRNQQQQQQRQQPQQAPLQNQWTVPHVSPPHQYPTQNQWPSPQRPPSATYGPNQGQGQGPASGQPDAAFRAAQEKLDILRHLGGGI
ncbi:hypothetical protein MMC16_004011 [Acarospora aff. strigata]|nr:hypothetical protein [Acarospora aff. strigata]